MGSKVQITQSHLRKDPDNYPLLVLISDGRTNVSYAGGKPFTEALREGQMV